MSDPAAMPKRALSIPIVALALAGAAFALPGHGWWRLGAVAVALFGAVLSAVHHAEVVALASFVLRIPAARLSRREIWCCSR